MDSTQLTRRPIRARDTKWAAAAARWLARIGFRPNQISLLSVVFAAGSGACLFFTRRVSDPTAACLFVGAAICIQFRLLCNLFDGMVAVEGGFRTKSGELYNELPDRFADALILVGASYSVSSSAWLPTLGWAAAAFAVITAYVRALGASAGAKQYFLGPMAKQQRMAVMTAACLGTAVCFLMKKSFSLIPLALGVVVVGCAITIWRRCILIARELDSR